LKQPENVEKLFENSLYELNEMSVLEIV
jgi:hypothetical protein